MRILTINSYAGSLLIAAQSRKDEIIASLEDKNYGAPIQRENFPDLEIYGKIDHWPTLDLSEAVVIGHPPCAAFSAQNRGGAHVRGPDSAAFRCTINLLEYAMRNQAAVIAIESVAGALEGGRAVHDRFALENRYDLYRVLINACSFGVAQYRKRFWALFVRKGLLRDGALSLTVEPRLRTVGDVMRDSAGGDVTHIDYVLHQTLKQLRLLREVMSPEQLEKFLEGRGSVVKMAPAFLKFEGKEAVEFQRRYTMGWNYISHSMVMLTGACLAPTLMAGSWWWYQNRCLSEEEYKDIMGFPRDYRFPGSFYSTRIREYLSRGVCPPTARWVLDQVERALGAENVDPLVTGTKVIRPGEVADFSVSSRARRGSIVEVI